MTYMICLEECPDGVVCNVMGPQRRACPTGFVLLMKGKCKRIYGAKPIVRLWKI